jgi:hypothetical protein
VAWAAEAVAETAPVGGAICAVHLGHPTGGHALRHASPKHLIAPGSPAGTVVQALRHVGPARAADVAQIAVYRLSASDKTTLATTAVLTPAWMRPTLVSIASALTGVVDG